MTTEILNEILAKHKQYLNGEKGGCRADLNEADLNEANLSGANLSRANLRYANLSGANLSGADLNEANGLLSSMNFMEAYFERSKDGYIVYKCFNAQYKTPKGWKIESGSILEEEVNPNRTNLWGCGINVAPLEWVKKEYPNKKIYKLIIKWEWLLGVVVPYNTNGKIRCSKAMIIGEVE